MQNGPRYLTSSDLDTFDTTKQDEFGALGQTEDGRYFRYVKFGGTSTIKAGLLCVGPAAPANSTALAVTAVGTSGQVTANLQAGSRQLVVTNGATAVTANQFQYLVVNSAADGIYTLRVAGNTAAAANTGYVTVLLADPLPQGVTQLIPGTDTVDLVLSEYNGVAPSTTGNAPVGVTVNAVPNSSTVTNYGWVQSGGTAKVQATSATIGLGVAQDLSGTAGYVIVTAATTGNVGWAKTTAASSAAVVKLNIN
jgi:hypothetical protein